MNSDLDVRVGGREREKVIARLGQAFSQGYLSIPDYETRLDVSDAMIHVAMGSLLLRRIAHD